MNGQRIWKKRKKITALSMKIIYQVFCWCNTLLVILYSDTIKILAELQTHICCWECSAHVPYCGSCGNYFWACNEAIHITPICLNITAFTLADGVVQCKLALCTQFCLLALILSLCFHILPSEHCGNVQSGHSAVIVC